MLKLIEDFLKSLISEFSNKKVEMLNNSGKDISLSTDKNLNLLITNFLKVNFPYPILSEEAEETFDFYKGPETFWIIDPLDGTLNFSREIPLNCISIGLIHQKEFVFGIIYDFQHQDLYIGSCKANPVTESVFATLNGQHIQVSTINNLSQSILCTGFPSYRDYQEQALLTFVKQVQDFKKVRCIGSAALSLAWVASGRTDAYFEEDIRIWDVAAGLAIVKAAGGFFKYDIGKAKNYLHVLAHNNKIIFSN